MKNKCISNMLLIIGMALVLLSCSNSRQNSVQSNESPLKTGIAKLRGKITDPTSSITVSYSNPITGDLGTMEAILDKDGNFYMELPVETSFTVASLVTSYGNFLIELPSDDETFVEIEVRNDSIINKTCRNESGKKPLFTEDDLTNIREVIFRFVLYRYKNEPIHRMDPCEMAKHELKILDDRLSYALEGASLSDFGRKFAVNECKLLFLKGRLLTYKGSVELSYSNFKKEEAGLEYIYREPDISYYNTFLKEFNLSDSLYVYNYYFPEMMQYFLSAQAFQIPPISDTPVNEWLDKVKPTLSGLLGFDLGLFYDLLVSNAYGKQFSEKLTPLSDRQKENIRNYFGDNDIAKALLRKNEHIITFSMGKDDVVVCETPVVPKEKLMDTIISEYQGKVVVLDFWATWCGPCLSAMEQMRSLKKEMKNKGVVFVYFTNPSSPKELWNEKIKIISGDHYYFSKKEQWTHLMEHFNFEYIPSYVIFDKNGEMVEKFDGYPGVTEMEKEIEKLL